MGVPGLSTTVSAIPEILLHNKSGITVAPSDPAIMATQIREILENKNLRNRVIQGGMEHTRKHFDNRVLVAKMGDIFREQLKANQKTAQ